LQQLRRHEKITVLHEKGDQTLKKLFLKRVNWREAPIPKDSAYPTVVMLYSGDELRVGLSAKENPHVIIEQVIVHLVVCGDLQYFYVGSGSYTPPNTCKIVSSYPLCDKYGNIVNFDIFEAVLKHICYYDLQINTEGYCMLLVTPPFITKSAIDCLSECMFLSFSFQQLAFQDSLSMCSHVTNQAIVCHEEH